MKHLSGIFYSFDTITKQRESLKTKDRETAEQLLEAKNQAHRQPNLNVQIARVFLAASDPKSTKRTWQDCFDEILKLKSGNTLTRWKTAKKDKALQALKSLPLAETRAEHFLRALEAGSVSTNVYLRRLQNFSIEMQWLISPVLTNRQWPKVRHAEKRAISLEEHQKIIGIEWDAERKAYYELLWHMGGAQSDIASLKAEDIDWQANLITYARNKTKVLSFLRFGPAVAAILQTLPKSGSLFPRISKMHEKHRAAEFKRRCRRLKIEGVTLHSYRFSWAERACQAGISERFAQIALGHNSKAVHRFYARKAHVEIPCLEELAKEKCR